MTPTSLLDLVDRPVLTMAAAQPVSQAIAHLQATRHDYLSFGSRCPVPPRLRAMALRVLAGPLLC